MANEQTPRGRGRPKSAEPGARLCTWVKASEYDRLVRLANQNETSVSALARALITSRFPKSS